MDENNLIVDGVNIDIVKNYFEKQQANSKAQNDKQNDMFAVVVSWNFEVNIIIIFILVDYKFVT